MYVLVLLEPGPAAADEAHHQAAHEARARCVEWELVGIDTDAIDS